MSTGENIRKRRIELKMSQQELADALGYKTRSSITKIEKDSSPLSHDKLLALSHVLQTTVDYILNGVRSDSVPAPGSVVSTEEMDQEPVGGKHKCVAVILAGGRNRVNSYGIPFQFVSVKDKPVIVYTMEAYQRHPLVDEIDVVCLDGWEDFLRPYAEKYNITKLKEIIPAGKTGIESVKNAVEWLTPTCRAYDVLLIQEATRPFIEPEVIANAVLCCKKYGSAVVFERMDRMTPFLLNENNTGMQHLNAYNLISVQSPEAYTMGALRQAFTEAKAINHTLDETICAVFMYHMGRDLKFCEGSHGNLRIVYDTDLKILEAMVE